MKSRNMQEANASKFALKGLEFVTKFFVYNEDLVKETTTFSLGGGMWSIEVLGYNGQCLKEFVGNNGADSLYEADDLWAKYDEWSKRLHHRVQLWESPDGTKGSFSWFLREAERGNLHSLLVTV